MTLKFYTGVTKGLKLKFRKFWRLISTFVEVTGEKLEGGAFLSPILNRVKFYSRSTVLPNRYCRLTVFVQQVLSINFNFFLVRFLAKVKKNQFWY